jgi:Putative adhesin
VIRAGVFTAVCVFIAAGGAVAKSKSGERERKPAPNEGWGAHFDFTLPDLPVLPMLPQLDLPDIDVDFDFDGDGPQVLARNSSRERVDDEEGEEDHDADDDVEVDEHDAKVKVYKLNPQRKFRFPRVHLGEDDHEADERDATAQAKGRGSASLAVNGPVTFQVRAQAGEVEVVSTDKRQVSVTWTEAPAEDIALFAFGDRIEPSFRGRRTLRRGKLRVELPRGSRLDLSSMSGDVTAQRIGDVRIRTMSGDVKLSGIAKADVQTVSGDARIENAAGPVRLHTVSGNGTVSTSSSAPQVEFHSASGSLDWSGLCARDCHLSAETVSGDVHLNVDPKSSFELSYTSHSGELRDEVSLAVKRAPKRKHGMASGWLEATFGRGEGVIEADAFSGSLVVKRK